MKIYISGQISNLPEAKARANFAAAAAAIRKKGHEPINPCRLQDLLDPKTTTWEQYMKPALALLEIADAVYFLPGWRKSKGSVLEYTQARQQGKHIFESPQEIWQPFPQGETEESHGRPTPMD